MRLFLAAVLAAWLAPVAAAFGGCGGTEAPCSIASGSYRIVRPPDTESLRPVPVVVHFYGAGGSSAGVLKNRTMVGAFLDRGYAFIAPIDIGGSTVLSRAIETTG